MRANYSIKSILDYKDRLTDSQRKILIAHCNEFRIEPDIIAWYDDLDDFYRDWTEDNKIYDERKEAYMRLVEGKRKGEFLEFDNGEIIRLIT